MAQSNSRKGKEEEVKGEERIEVERKEDDEEEKRLFEVVVVRGARIFFGGTLTIPVVTLYHWGAVGPYVQLHTKIDHNFDNLEKIGLERKGK